MENRAISEEEEAKFTNYIITFILNKAGSKYPIKSTDIAETVDRNSAILKLCFSKARQVLSEVYAIDVVEVPDSKSGKKYIAISKDTAASLREYDHQQQRELTLLFIILAYILMCGGSVKEDELEQYLQGLNISLNRDHEFFGSVKKLLETFTRQLYLHRNKCDLEYELESRYAYIWGFRSTCEFNKLQMLEVTAKILKKSPKLFIQQYREACASQTQPTLEG